MPHPSGRPRNGGPGKSYWNLHSSDSLLYRTFMSSLQMSRRLRVGQPYQTARNGNVNEPSMTRATRQTRMPRFNHLCMPAHCSDVPNGSPSVEVLMELSLFREDFAIDSVQIRDGQERGDEHDVVDPPSDDGENRSGVTQVSEDRHVHHIADPYHDTEPAGDDQPLVAPASHLEERDGRGDAHGKHNENQCEFPGLLARCARTADPELVVVPEVAHVEGITPCGVKDPIDQCVVGHQVENPALQVQAGIDDDEVSDQRDHDRTN